MWFQPLDHIGRFPLIPRNPMKKIDKETKKRVCHGLMTHPPSTFNIQHLTFNIQHSTFNIQHSLLAPRLAQIFEDGGYLAGREILATLLVA